MMNFMKGYSLKRCYVCNVTMHELIFLNPFFSESSPFSFENKYIITE